jgi:hypothetical protein
MVGGLPCLGSFAKDLLKVLGREYWGIYQLYFCMFVSLFLDKVNSDREIGCTMIKGVDVTANCEILD